MKKAESNSVTSIPQCSCLSYQEMFFYFSSQLNKKVLLLSIQKCHGTNFTKKKKKED